MAHTEMDTSRPADRRHCHLVSVVIEWDNARVSKLVRARNMYRVLVGQIRRLHDDWDSYAKGGSRTEQTITRVIEVFVLYDALEIEPAVIEAVTSAPGSALPDGVALHVVGTPGLGYYDLKNEGAKHARGDIVVFLDSDVIPEPDWLDEILRPFRDPAIQVVAGNSYIEPVSLYSRAFALTWFFPLRTPVGPLATTSCFFANNFAGRREVLRQYPFPDQPRFRGQCTTLAKTLVKDGVSICANPNAHIAHPAPNGVSHFFRRAIWEGHDVIVDHCLRGALAPVGTGESIRLSYSGLRTKASQLWRTVQSQRGQVGLSAVAAPLAFAIALVYYTTCAVGEILSRRDPHIIRRHFPI